MLTVTALFTKNTGDPATGLVLAEIALNLYQRAKADGAVTTVWSAVQPTEEIGGGLYSKSYADDDPALYQYFAFAQYTGLTVLDTNFALYSGSDAVDSSDVWTYATRTLTSTAAETTAAISGGNLTIPITASYAATITGLTIPSTWIKLWLTLKASLADADASANLQLVVSNPAASTIDGVLYLEAVAATTAQRMLGSLTVSQAAGTVAIALDETLTAKMESNIAREWDIKCLESGGACTILTSGTAAIVWTVTRAMV